MNFTTWSLYVSRFGEGMTQAQVGEKAGVDQATAGRWIKGSIVPKSAGNVAALARGFGRNPLEAFVAAGFLSVEEAGAGLSPESVGLLNELAKDASRSQALADVYPAARAEYDSRRNSGEILGSGAFVDIIQRMVGDVASDLDDTLAEAADEYGAEDQIERDQGEHHTT